LSQLGDRRTSPRLEVVGSLWASLELSEAARVLNASDSGALIASRTPVAVDAVQALRLRLDGRDVAVTARVKHLRQAIALNGESEYLIGVEFVRDGDSSAL